MEGTKAQLQTLESELDERTKKQSAYKRERAEMQREKDFKWAAEKEARAEKKHKKEAEKKTLVGKKHKRRLRRRPWLGGSSRTRLEGRAGVRLSPQKTVQTNGQLMLRRRALKMPVRT